MKCLLLFLVLSFITSAINYTPDPVPKLKIQTKYKSDGIKMKWRLNRFEMKTDDWKFKFKFSKKKVNAQIKIRF